MSTQDPYAEYFGLTTPSAPTDDTQPVDTYRWGERPGQQFGAPRDGGTRQHVGADRYDVSGEIRAEYPGKVTFAGTRGGYGNLVEYDIGEDENGNRITIRHGHLANLNTKVGDEVPRGYVFGKQGATGNAQGVHDHYEVRVAGVPQNPRKYQIKLRKPTGAGGDPYADYFGLGKSGAAPAPAAPATYDGTPTPEDVQSALYGGSNLSGDAAVGKAIHSLDPKAPKPYVPGQGMIKKGTLDLTNRPQVKNPDGSISTVRSASFGTPEGEVLIPTVSKDGRLLTNEQALAEYRKTGESLGTFDTPENATAYAQWVHQDQANALGGGMAAPGAPVDPLAVPPQHPAVARARARRQSRPTAQVNAAAKQALAVADNLEQVGRATNQQNLIDQAAAIRAKFTRAPKPAAPGDIIGQALDYAHDKAMPWLAGMGDAIRGEEAKREAQALRMRTQRQPSISPARQMFGDRAIAELAPTVRTADEQSADEIAAATGRPSGRLSARGAESLRRDNLPSLINEAWGDPIGHAREFLGPAEEQAGRLAHGIHRAVVGEDVQNDQPSTEFTENVRRRLTPTLEQTLRSVNPYRAIVALGQAATDTIRARGAVPDDTTVGKMVQEYLDAQSAAAEHLTFGQQSQTRAYDPHGVGTEVGSIAGDVPAFVGGSAAGLPMPALMAGQAALSSRRVETPEGTRRPETEAERGHAILSGLVTGKLMPAISERIPGAPFRALDEVIEQKAPILAPLSLGGRGHAATAMAATAYPVAAIMGEPMPGAWDVARSSVLGAAIFPGGPVPHEMVLPKPGEPAVFIDPKRGPIAGDVIAVDLRGNYQIQLEDGHTVVLEPRTAARQGLQKLTPDLAVQLGQMYPESPAPSLEAPQAPRTTLEQARAGVVRATRAGEPYPRPAGPSSTPPVVERVATPAERGEVVRTLGRGEPVMERVGPQAPPEATAPEDAIWAEQGGTRTYLIRSTNGDHATVNVMADGRVTADPILNRRKMALAGRSKAITVPADEFQTMISGGTPPDIRAEAQQRFARDARLTPGGQTNVRPNGREPLRPADAGQTPVRDGTANAAVPGVSAAGEPGDATGRVPDVAAENARGAGEPGLRVGGREVPVQPVRGPEQLRPAGGRPGAAARPRDDGTAPAAVPGQTAAPEAANVPAVHEVGESATGRTREGTTMAVPGEAGVQTPPTVEGARPGETPVEGRGQLGRETAAPPRDLPPMRPLPEQGQYAAVRTDDGSIYFDPNTSQARTHRDLIDELGIPHERVVDGGIIRDGDYEPREQSDSARLGEQARARIRVEQKRAARVNEPTLAETEARYREEHARGNPVDLAQAANLIREERANATRGVSEQRGPEPEHRGVGEVREAAEPGGGDRVRRAEEGAAPETRAPEARVETPQTREEKLIARLQRGQDEADAALKKKLGGVNFIADPTVIGDLAKREAYRFAKGAVKFEKWARDMIAEHGPEIADHLRGIYDRARAMVPKIRRDAEAAEGIRDAKRKPRPYNPEAAKAAEAEFGKRAIHEERPIAPQSELDAVEYARFGKQGRAGPEHRGNGEGGTSSEAGSRGGVRRAAEGEEAGAEAETPDGQTRGVGVLAAKSEPKLLARHNTSAAGILAADRLGGIPMPSLAVTRADQPFASFGDVTLVGRREMVDPKAGGNLHEADAYSPRQPRQSYDILPRGERAVADDPLIRGAYADLGKYRFDSDVYGFHGDRNAFQSSVSNDEAMQLAYLRSKGVEVPIKPTERGASFEDRERVRRENYLAITDAMGDRYDSAYREWVADKLKPMFSEPYLQRGRRKVSYTAENVLADMLRRPKQGAEDTMTQGLGKARAAGARSFPSIEAARAEADNLVDKATAATVYEKNNKELFSIAEKLQADQGFSGFGGMWDSIDGVGSALRRYIKAKGKTEQAMRAAFRAERYDVKDPDIIKQAMDLAETVKRAPTEYFEGKPRRMVGLDEFAGAVVPPDLPASARAALERAGLKVVTHEGTAESRQEAIGKFENALFSRPSESLISRRAPTEPPFQGVEVKPGRSVRTAHEIDVDSATAEKIKRALVNQKDWDGVTIPMPLVERVITNLRAGERTKEIQTLLNGLAQAKQRFDNGRGPNSVRVIDVNAVRRASVGEKGVRREESWHVTQYHHTYEATGQHDGVDWQTPTQWERLPKDIADTVLTEVVKRGYADAKTNHDVKVLEASAKIAGEVDALGLTEEQVVAFMNHTYDAIAENFGPDAIFEYDANSRRAIIAQKEAYARAKGKAADQDVGAGSEGTQRTVSDQAPAGEGSVRQGGEGEVSGNRGEAEALAARTGPGAKLTDAELAEDMPDLVEWSKQERGHETDTFAKWSKQFSRDVASRISPDYARALGPHLRDIYREVTKPTAAPVKLPTEPTVQDLEQVQTGVPFEATLHRGTAHGQDEGEYGWFTSLAPEADRYAKAAGIRSKSEGAVDTLAVSLRNPYVTDKPAEAINVSKGTIARLRGEGYDGLIYKSNGRPAFGSMEQVPPYVWAVPFDVSPRTIKEGRGAAVEAAKPKERPPMSPAEARAKYPTGLDENGEVVPEAYYNQRTPGDISDETRAKLNAGVVKAVKERGIAPKIVRKNEQVEKGALLIVRDNPELAAGVKNWKPGDVIPDENVQRAAQLLIENMSRESAELEEKLANDKNLTEGQKVDLRDRITRLDDDVVGLLGGTMQMTTEYARMLQAKGIKRGEGVNAEQIIRRIKNRAIVAGADVETRRFRKQSADIVKKATVDNDTSLTARNLVEALKRIGVDPKSLVKTNGDLMTPEEAVATVRKAPVKIKPEPAPKPLKQKVADLSDRLKAREAAAWARINAKKGRLSSGIDPTLIADFADVGAAILMRKGIDLATWTAEMVGHFGEEIRPHLDRIRGMAHAVIAEERKNERMERDRRTVERNPEKYGDDIEAGLEQLAADRKANQERLRALKAETLAPGREGQVRGRTLGVIPEAPSGAGHKVSTRMTYENRLIARSRAAEARLKADPQHATTQAGIEDMGAVGAAELVNAPDGAAWHATMKQRFGDAYDQNQRAVMDVTGNLFNEARSRDQEQSMNRRAGVPEAATPEQRDQIVRDYVAAERARIKARTSLIHAMNAMERTSKAAIISAVRKAGMLTGLKTTARNLGGNTAFQMIEEGTRNIASWIDMAVAPLTGHRTITATNATALNNAAYEAAHRGVREFLEIMKEGMTQEEMNALQFNRELNSGNKYLDAYVNTTFRFLGAQDRIFRVFAYRRALEDRARAQALTERRTDKTVDVKKRTAELVETPTSELSAGAIGDAEMAVFQNKNLISTGIAGFRRAIGDTGNLVVDTFLPFDKTPTNIALRMLDYSPVGLARTAMAAKRMIDGKIDGTFNAEDQRAFAQSAARASVGSVLLSLGFALGAAGYMTGTSDDDQSKRTRDEAAGRTPGAIKGFGDWNQIIGFAPIGTLMAIGAAAYREWAQERKDPTTTGVHIAALGAKALLEIPMLKGSKDVLEAINSPATAGNRFMGGLAASMVPTIVGDVAGIGDTRRDTRGSLLAPLINKIPGWRQTLPQKFDALGRPMENPESGAVLPWVPKTAREDVDPVDRELVKLDVGLTYPQRQIGESDDTYRQRSQQVGQLANQSVAKVVANPEYQSLAQLPDGRERQKAMITGALQDAKSPTNQPRFDTEQDAQIFDHNTTVEATKQEIISQLHQQPGWFNLTKKDQDALENSAGARVDNFKFRYTGRETEEQAAARFERLKGVAETLADPERRRVYVESLFDEKAPKKPPSVPKPLAP